MFPRVFFPSPRVFFLLDSILLLVLLVLLVLLALLLLLLHVPATLFFFASAEFIFKAFVISHSIVLLLLLHFLHALILPWVEEGHGPQEKTEGLAPSCVHAAARREILADVPSLVRRCA
jgi:hypothetical protein